MPQRSNNRRFRPARAGRFAAGLRLATHNIRGFRGQGGAIPAHKVGLLFNEWRRLQLHIVCVQEVKIGAGDHAAKAQVERALSQAAQAAGVPSQGYKVYWGCRQVAPLQSSLVGDSPARRRSLGGNAAGGVAVLIRRDLLVRDLRVMGTPQVDQDGRLMHMQLEWRGAPLHLVNVYLPSGRPAQQQRFVRERLGPLMQGRVGPWVLAGDFNFTPSWVKDRAWVAGVGQGGDRPESHKRDEGPAKALAALAGEVGVRDAFRHRHPTRAAYTYVCGTAASRIDHLYVSSSLLPHLLQCDVHGLSVSDHRPVVMHLAPIGRRRQGPGLARARIAFARDRLLLRQLQEWVAEQATAAPLGDDRRLLGWWPAFKHDLAVRIRDLNLEHRALRQQAAAEVREAEQQQGVAEAALVAAPAGPISQAALQAVVEARRRHVAASMAAAADHEAARRRCAVAEGEHPSSAITRIVSRPASASLVTALRKPSGGLVASGPQMAREMARFFAAISARHTPDPTAVTRVLGAVDQHSTRLGASGAATVGDAEVSAAEIAAAIKHTKPGTAPGPDGLAPEVWRHCGDAATQLLAALFSAIGRTASTPDGFLEGVICPIFKGGEATLPANYRPICLLNTDYRLLTKCLAKRLGSVIGQVVGPQQNAFVPGRCITANIAFLQSLPDALRCQGRGAVLAFLDIRKAYDTVSRPFLLQVMQRLGVGDGMLRWVRTLLSDTASAACVNGHVSAPVLFEEGVRQGCPLAPALFLFAAQALWCWLKACPVVGVGVVPGQWAHAMQFADDTAVVLKDPSPSTVHQFLEHMRIYRGASGQALNAAKSRLLPIGEVRAFGQVPSVVGGIPVESETGALGVAFANGGDPATRINWQERVPKAHQRFSRLAKLGLSVFGRAQCAGAYGVSRVLFHAGHSGMPGEIAQDLWRKAVALVDRGVGPDSQRRSLPGVHSQLLVGRPSKGGFGLLPMEQHIRARHAMFAKQLVVWLAGDPTELQKGDGSDADQPQPLWVSLVAHQLRTLCPAAHPALALLAVAAAQGVGAMDRLPGQAVRAWPQPGLLALMMRGLVALGPPSDLVQEQLPPDLIPQMPLWGNPLLQLELRREQRTVKWPLDDDDPGAATARGEHQMAARLREQQCGFGVWVGTPGLFTVADLCTLVYILRGVRTAWQRVRRSALPPQGPLSQVWGVHTVVGLPPLVAQLFRAWDPTARPWEQELPVAVEAMFAALPQHWQTAARQWHAQQAPQHRLLVPTQTRLDSDAVEDAVRAVVRRMGWKGVTLTGMAVAPQPAQDGEGRDPTKRPFYPLSVRWATVLQLRREGFFWAQNGARRQYVSDALFGVGAVLSAAQEAQVDGAQGQFGAAMRRLWLLPWENERKETLWRLAVNGVQGAGGHDISLSGACLCGWAGPVRSRPEPERAREWRQHCFWACPVAREVVLQLQGVLPGRALAKAQVWLLHAPCDVHQCVWEPVCAAALDAMAFGRRMMWSLHLSEQSADPRQTLITQFFLPVQQLRLPSVVVRAARRAAARFWERLQDLVMLDDFPVKDQRWDGVPPDHPFVGVEQVPQRPGKPLRFVLNLPAVAQQPDA